MIKKSRNYWYKIRSFDSIVACGTLFVDITRESFIFHDTAREGKEEGKGRADRGRGKRKSGTRAEIVKFIMFHLLRVNEFQGKLYARFYPTYSRGVVSIFFVAAPPPSPNTALAVLIAAVTTGPVKRIVSKWWLHRELARVRCRGH